MTTITVNGYEAKLDRVEQLPTGPLNYATVQFVFAQSDTAWDGATLTATFSAITPKGARVTLPSPVDNEGIAIIPEKILAVKGSVLTAGLCGTWETNGVSRRITSNMVKVCTLIPGAAGADLQEGINNAVDEKDVFDFIEESVASVKADMAPLEIENGSGRLSYSMSKISEEFSTGRPITFQQSPVVFVQYVSEYPEIPSKFVVLDVFNNSISCYTVNDETHEYTKESEKFAVSDKNANANKIEKIYKADGTELSPISKAVTLPDYAMPAADIYGMTGNDIRTAWNAGKSLRYQGKEIITLQNYTLGQRQGVLFGTVEWYKAGDSQNSQTRLYQFFLENTVVASSTSISGLATAQRVAVTFDERAKLSGGSVASGNNSFVTGGQVYDAIAEAINQLSNT